MVRIGTTGIFLSLEISSSHLRHHHPEMELSDAIESLVLPFYLELPVAAVPDFPTFSLRLPEIPR